MKGCRKKLIGKGGWHNLHQIFDLHCTLCRRNGSHEATNCKFPWDKIKEDIQNHKENKGKTSELAKGKAPTHYIVSHCNIGVTEELFNTSFPSWRDAWLLDIGATSHMTFKRDRFEDFDENVDGIVYFADR
jgi:hypothetical protein